MPNRIKSKAAPWIIDKARVEMDAFRDAKVIVKRFDFKFSSAGWAFSNRH